jgi:fucose permease
MVSLAVAVNLLPVFLTTLSRTLGGAAGGLTDEQLGRIGAVTFAGLVTAILLTGPLADWWGGLGFAVGGNVLIAAGLLLLGFAPGYRAVLLATFVMGFGAGTLDMILSPIVAALRPERRTVAMNLLHSFYCIGAVATILAGAAALRVGMGWRVVSLGLVPMPVLIGIGFLGLRRLPPLVGAGEVRTPVGSLLRRPFFVVTLAAIFLGGATELGFAYWLPAYAEKSLGFSRWAAGMAFLGFSSGMAVGRLGIALLPHALGPIRLMLACCAATLVLFLLACFAPSRSVALGACVLAGVSGSCLWPSTLALAADRFPHGGASMFGLLAACGNFGGIFMPWAAGVVADRSSLRLGLASTALCPLLMIAALLWIASRRRRAEPDAERTLLPVAVETSASP